MGIVQRMLRDERLMVGIAALLVLESFVLQRRILCLINFRMVLMARGLVIDRTSYPPVRGCAWKIHRDAVTTRTHEKVLVSGCSSSGRVWTR